MPKINVNPLFQRLALITGAEALEKLAQTRALVFGVGGVGSWCAEALARSGIGKIGLIDSDTVCITNVNRQIQATTRTVGMPKVEVLKQRLLEINPRCEVETWEKVFSRESAGAFNIENAQYVIDAIDSLAYKLDLIEIAHAAGLTLFSSMGMAQKMDPTRIKTADIWETSGCPLARLVRQGLRKRGFSGGFTAVYSDEQPPRQESFALACGSRLCLCAQKGGNRSAPNDTASGAPDAVPGGVSDNAPDEARPEWCSGKKVINGSAVTVTASAGMILASLVLRDITSNADCAAACDAASAITGEERE